MVTITFDSRTYDVIKGATAMKKKTRCTTTLPPTGGRINSVLNLCSESNKHLDLLNFKENI